MEPQPYEGRRRRRRGLGWLWPLLALILLLLLVLMLVRACGDDDDGDGGAGGGATTAQTDDGGGASGSGTVSGDELLAASGGSLAEFAGRDVEITDTGVLSVVQDAGFWIGSGDDERVFVEIEDETGLDELGLQEGDTVSFTGTVEENLEAETYGLTGDDAAMFREQGAHIRVQAADIEKS